MQLLEHTPETRSYSNEEGHFIEGFLIGTKPNEARWRISKKTAHELVQKFVGKDFAIIPELIQKPLSQGGGGHYFGLDTKPDLLNGYATHSHGKYTKVKGPYSYNDGTDDFFYEAQIKLRDSKAASALLAEGQKTWIPFAVSPHIWPLSGPDDNIEDWEPIGGALVIKGAYGPQAVISKMCKGTSAQCEKSLGASETKCEDTETAEIISSLVSKSASLPHTMTETSSTVTTEISKQTTVPTVAQVELPTKSATLDSQNAITSGMKVVTPEQFDQISKEKAELEKQVTQLVNESKMNTLNNMFVKVKDEKVKKELLDEFAKYDKSQVDLINGALTRLYPIIKASEEPVQEEDEEEKKKEAKKGKAASTLPKERELPKLETTESKTASIPENKTKTIYNFIMKDGGF